ncbi:MAG: FAD-dependent oxidoreductase [Thermoanaerobaculia bacterium]
MTARRVVLLGGGHAHVHVLTRAAQVPLQDVELVLISPHPHHLYSGMVPGYLQGTYQEAEMAFDLRVLAERARARFVEGAAIRIDAGERIVELADESLSFDLLSVDIGSEPAGLATAGVREHALSVRPMNRAIALRERAEALLGRADARPVAIVVVGGGAAGVEIALALERQGREHGRRALVTIVEGGPVVLPELSGHVRRVAADILGRRSIRLKTGKRVSSIEAGAVVLDDGSRERADLTVWLAGAAPPRLFADSDLPRDPAGYLLVDSTLRAVDGAPIFGAGDCIGLVGHPDLAKAGVYAVREAPVLDHNLRAALAGRPSIDYRPQRTFLALLNTADGRAIWRWRNFSGHSHFAWWLKDRIDRRFVRRYQVSA